MKTKYLLLALGNLIIPALAMAQTPVLVDTQSYSWSLTQNLQLVGNTDSGTVSANTSINGVSVSHYTGALDLTRVVIRILQPATSVSPTINASIAVATGESTTFTSNLDSNSISETTSFMGSKWSVYTALKNLVGGTPIGNYTNQVFSADFTSVTLVSPETITRTLDLTQSYVTLFDSSSYSISSANLNTIFRDSSNITINGGLTSANVSTAFSFERDNTSLLTTTITGTNSGKVSIEYYAVPEPRVWALLAFSLTTVLVLRRRRNY